MLDTIPMHEILSVTEMNDDPSSMSRASRRSHASKNISLLGSSLRKDSSYSSQKSSMDKQQAVRDTDHESNSKRLTAVGVKNVLLQIETIPNGFNFGKNYYLRVTDQSIVTELATATKVAKMRMCRKSTLQKCQDDVRQIQESVIFQIIMALFITTVRAFLDKYIFFSRHLCDVTQNRRISLQMQWKRRLKQLTATEISQPSVMDWSYSTISLQLLLPSSSLSMHLPTGSNRSLKMAGMLSTSSSSPCHSSPWGPSIYPSTCSARCALSASCGCSAGWVRCATSCPR